MLIEFSVKNFRSLRDRKTFTLRKAAGDELDANTFEAEAVNRFHLLRSAAIYGPNAGGKSNLLLALHAMKRIVVGSATRLQPGDRLPVTPFRLSKATRRAPSEFEATFIVDKVRYQYGFSATEDRVHEEWLFAWPKGRPQRWFGRAWNEQSQGYDWEFGDKLSGEKMLWQKSTRDNALFLSTAVQLNSEQLQPIFDWFNRTLRTGGTSIWTPEITASLYADSEKTQVMGFLRAADLGIENFNIEKKPFEFPDKISELIKKEVSEKLRRIEQPQIKTLHKDDEGELEAFDFTRDESQGTQKMFTFAGPWIGSLANGYVLLIDELHDNLHPHLVRFLVQLFHSDKTNPNNAQLIFTTHETSMLNQKIFRRDQIWFCEKEKDQATEIYPLTDFRPRKGRENLESAYLSGRYGALPYVRPREVQPLREDD